MTTNQIYHLNEKSLDNDELDNFILEDIQKIKFNIKEFYYLLDNIDIIERNNFIISSINLKLKKFNEFIEYFIQNYIDGNRLPSDKFLLSENDIIDDYIKFIDINCYSEKLNFLSNLNIDKALNIIVLLLDDSENDNDKKLFINYLNYIKIFHKDLLTIKNIHKSLIYLLINKNDLFLENSIFIYLKEEKLLSYTFMNLITLLIHKKKIKFNKYLVNNIEYFTFLFRYTNLINIEDYNSKINFLENYLYYIEYYYDENLDLIELNNLYSFYFNNLINNSYFLINVNDMFINQILESYNILFTNFKIHQRENVIEALYSFIKFYHNSLLINIQSDESKINYYIIYKLILILNNIYFIVKDNPVNKINRFLINEKNFLMFFNDKIENSIFNLIFKKLNDSNRFYFRNKKFLDLCFSNDENFTILNLYLSYIPKTFTKYIIDLKELSINENCLLNTAKITSTISYINYFKLGLIFKLNNFLLYLFKDNFLKLSTKNSNEIIRFSVEKNKDQYLKSIIKFR